jgi:hypothetical protein
VTAAVVGSIALLMGSGITPCTRAALAEPEGNQVMLGFWFDSADRKSLQLRPSLFPRRRRKRAARGME